MSIMCSNKKGIVLVGQIMRSLTLENIVLTRMISCIRDRLREMMLDGLCYGRGNIFERIIPEQCQICGETTPMPFYKTDDNVEMWYLLICFLIIFFHSPIGEEGVTAILKVLIPMGAPLLESGQLGDLQTFPDLMMVLQTLAGVGSGYGHVILFESAVQWLEIWYVQAKQLSV